MSRPEPARDRWGRYLLPDPTTGAIRSYTRTTTLAKALSDTSALERWGKRMVAKGLTLRPDLADVVAMTELDDRDTLDSMCAAAMEAAGAGGGAAAGAELHGLTERVDLGELRLTDVPDEHVDDVRAYVWTMARAGVEILPEHVERIIVQPGLEVAGTYDRMVRLPDGRLVIADLKTGKDLGYAWGDIAIQLAIYAHAPVVWSWAREDWDPMPAELDRTVGLVMHLPVGHATCTLWEVDLAAGWEAAQLAADVRAWRGRRSLAQVFTGRPAAAGLAERIQRAVSVTALEALWVAEREHWTPEHIEAAKRRKSALTSA